MRVLRGGQERIRSLTTSGSGDLSSELNTLCRKFDLLRWRRLRRGLACFPQEIEVACVSEDRL
jgi:hypothetical protein